MNISIKNKIWSNFYRIFIIITGVPVSIFMIYNTPVDSPYRLYFLIPLLFTMLIGIFSKTSKNITYLGMLALLIIMYIKYIIMPFINCLSQYILWRGVVPKGDFVEFGIVLTIYEMILVITTINIFESKFYRVSEKTEIMLPRKINIYIVFIILALIVTALYPSLLNDIRFIFSSKSSMFYTNNNNISGVFKTIFNFGKLMLLLLIISYNKLRYDKRESIYYVFISCFFVIMYLSFSGGVSRWTIVTPGIVLLYMLTQLFKKHSKLIICTIGGTTLIGLVIISSVKMKFDFEIPKAIFWSDMLQMYFSGPKNMAFAIETKQYINQMYGYLPLNILFNDLFGSVASISRFTNNIASTPRVFNSFVYRNYIPQDQIIPLMGQSTIYFGYILAPLLTIMTTIMMMFLDKKANKSSDIMKFYIYSYTSIWFARAMTLNITIIFSHFVNTLLLFLSIKWINDKIVFYKS